MNFRTTRSVKYALAAAVSVGISFLANAATVAVPAIPEDDLISGLNTPLRSAGRTYQGYIDRTELGSVSGTVNITGMQFRLAISDNNGVVGNWPSQPINFSQYDVQLSRGSAAVQADREFLSSAVPFANNMDAGRLTTVRSGAMAIPAGSFPQDGGLGVHSFGFNINFTTPYTYNAGEELVYLIRLAGYTPSTEPQAFFASDDYAPASVDAVSSTAGATATTPSGFSSPMYVQFTYSAVPEPATLSCLAGAALLMIRRRQG